MTTAEEIKNAAKKAEKSSIRPGCFNLNPPVSIIHVKSGRVLTATRVDIDGQYPNTGSFEIVK
jgi:hypothetical protein